MKKAILLCLLQAIFIFCLPAMAQTSTAEETWDFSALGRNNSGGNGFRKQKDKLKVSNIFSQDGTAMFADNNNKGALQTVIIKAEGGAVNKTFTFKNLGLRNYSTTAALDVFTITLRDYFGAAIASLSLAAQQSMTTAEVPLSGFNFTTPFPTGGYAGVAEIQVDFRYAGAATAPDELTFDNITVADVKASVPLPLTLVEFTVRKEGAGVRIHWKTANEQNIEKLILEHSTDGVQYTALASFAASQQASAMTSYTHYHATPAAGRNYYRLKEKTVGGDEKLYEVKSIDIAKNSLSISGANPVDGPLQVKGLTAGVYDISVADMSGRIMHQAKITNNGSGTYSFHLPPAINRGTYLVKVNGNGGQVSMKVVKQ